jgi:hypothetical protein
MHRGCWNCGAGSPGLARTCGPEPFDGIRLDLDRPVSARHAGDEPFAPHERRHDRVDHFWLSHRFQPGAAFVGAYRRSLWPSNIGSHRIGLVCDRFSRPGVRAPRMRSVRLVRFQWGGWSVYHRQRFPHGWRCHGILFLWRIRSEVIELYETGDRRWIFKSVN